MTRLTQRVEKRNAHGQLTITGRLQLMHDTVMHNRHNDGLCPLDREWSEPSRILVPAGTEVEYKFKETRCGNYHTVVYRDNRGVFYASQKK